MELRTILARPYPRIETHNGIPILRLDENVLMRLPPLNAPLALNVFKTRLPAEIQRDFEIALFRRIEGPEPSDIAFLLDILKQCPAT